MVLKNSCKIISIAISLILIMLLLDCVKNEKVIKYSAVKDYYVNYNNTTYLVTRKFEWLGKEYFIAVDTNSFKTFKIPKNKTTKSSISLQEKKIINDILNIPPLSNYISTRNKNNIYLTVDLCQSSKSGFEEDFFKVLIKYGKEHKKVINISISLTARWTINHQKEFNMLKKWDNNKDLIITWVNHTYNHFYDSKLPNSENFMIHDIKNAYNEIINNEIYMLKNGITPSVFFRFPGLIYNEKLLKQLKSFNLVAINSDTWLAKKYNYNIGLDVFVNQQGDFLFKNGSIILVHGNKNEHIGIEIFLKLLKQGKFDNYSFGSLSSILLDMKNNKLK